MRIINNMLGCFLVMLMIAGCVMITAPVTVTKNSNHHTEHTIITPPSNTVNDCDLSHYQHLLVLPELPDIPKDKLADSVYVETVLVNNIKLHRLLLKQLKEKSKACVKQ